VELIPAIDLREGRVVRLEQGDDRRRRVYDLDPVDVLRRYADAGVGRVHVVDLDAALGGAPQRQLIEGLLAVDGVPRIQLGGGLRDAAAVEWAFDAGCERVVLTSLLVRDFPLFAELVERFPRRLVPALDCAGGVLQAAGWTEAVAGGLEELMERLLPLPLPAVLVTDVERDGTLRGPNLELACAVARGTGAPALLSGGVASLADLETAARAPEVAGAIVGRALLDGRIDLAAAIEASTAVPQERAT
jgi:phosphoribosylformimino-5-aminoimidazole carboxamide ribotide isomerase